MKRGCLHGETADEHPCKTVKDPVSITDLHATLYKAMGIPPKLPHPVEEHPFYTTQDGKGVPIESLCA